MYVCNRLHICMYVQYMFTANLFCSVENSNNTGLIVGLVVGLVASIVILLLLIGILCLYCYKKKNQSCGKFIITFGDRR